MPKVMLRDRLLQQRQSLSPEACLELSLRAQQRLCDTPEFSTAQTLALYSPIRNEVFTERLFAAAAEIDIRVAYPRMRGEQLEFILVEELSALVPGRMGVLEPSSGRVVDPEAIDLMVLPGVGFDRGGHRLGYGRGFYDRLLGGLERRPHLAGLGFEIQVVDRLPRDPHDVRLDLLVTEMHVWRFSPGADVAEPSTNLSQKGRV